MLTAPRRGAARAPGRHHTSATPCACSLFTSPPSPITTHNNQTHVPCHVPASQSPPRRVDVGDGARARPREWQARPGAELGRPAGATGLATAPVTSVGTTALAACQATSLRILVLHAPALVSSAGAENPYSNAGAFAKAQWITSSVHFVHAQAHARSMPARIYGPTLCGCGGAPPRKTSSRVGRGSFFTVWSLLQFGHYSYSFFALDIYTYVRTRSGARERCVPRRPELPIAFYACSYGA